MVMAGGWNLTPSENMFLQDGSFRPLAVRDHRDQFLPTR